ncbi:xanthine dehydrogenase accessory protein XdhC [Tropicimonas sp. IMCC34011]|uniref:xanthine dehydrogenase accessory protein XdhC n=1 Tax=Tropicimonas sp. IMCC34011 TaxID=2248759 RepID=UPI000E26D5CE|nr:xanthine dehydrogenase accessory protein XdhC [Tropicimonas sp. IMCC34011]
MSFDEASLRRAVARHGRVARIAVAEAKGSVPREAGTSMLVWPGGQEGTIGGGTLEWQATERALARLAEGGAAVETIPLGPGIGQCCGGAVKLLTEVWDDEALARLRLERGHAIRPLSQSADAPPSAFLGRLDRPAVHLSAGWAAEPLARSGRPLWIWGAGHVGRALAAVMAPLPGWDISLLDIAPERFPEDPAAVPVIAPEVAPAAARAPAEAAHLIVTHSHARDLEICHRLLLRDFAFAGLIGSETKRARFGARLRQMGHSDASAGRITCPIGDPALGKHPQAIALGVATSLLRLTSTSHEGSATA